MAEGVAPASPARRDLSPAWRAGLWLLALVATVLAWAAALAAALWADLGGSEREALAALLLPRAALVVLLALLLPALLAALFVPWWAAWPRAARRLSEQVAIAKSANAAHRMEVQGAPEMRRLASVVDGLAQAHAALHVEMEQRVAEALAKLADETRRLAVLMSQLPQAVLVCNRDGRILLYNARASQLLGSPGAPAPLGLGRPLAGLVDPGALAHAWQQVQRRLQQGDGEVAVTFVTRHAAAGDGTMLLRAQMVPTPAGDGGVAGYLLIVDDITRTVAEQGRRDTLLQRLTEGTRSALGNLRAAAQTLRQYPTMDSSRRERFTAVVHDEAERLAQQLEQALREPVPASGWPLEQVRCGDLMVALQQELGARAGVECRLDAAPGDRWLEVDSHSLVRMLGELGARLASELGVRQLSLELQQQGPFERLDLVWHGAALDPARLASWEAVGGVRDVLDRHGAELWALPEGPSGPQRLCLQLVAARGAGASSVVPPARPVYYDFDLFHQAGQNAQLDDTPLTALAYTVFDTETTGLRPSEGDEIIAIGAVRVVNGRLLEEECLDRRTKPRRPVRASAQAVHGISTAMLEQEPPLEQVLPAFASFAEGTVLVAHNAAFDMRFLELARSRTGITFDQPVLDTLLLSAVVAPGHGEHEHGLEQIALRLGVDVRGRHQALADAVVTAEVLMKLLPLLAERGITTLGQARAASLRVVQARERF